MASNSETASLLGKNRVPDPHTSYGSVAPQKHAGPTKHSYCQSTSSSDNNADDDFGDITFPPFWEPMNSKTVVGVPVDLGSEEAFVLNTLFKTGCDKVITKIIRIQNPRLWAHYCRKRRQMEGEGGGRRVREYKLFHGTEARHVDSICRKGFEVGRSGDGFGSRFGKGIYFAQESMLAHRFAVPPRTLQEYPQILTSPLITTASMDTREFKDINYDLGWRAAHPLISSLECSGSEGEVMVFDHQRREYRGYEVHDFDEQDDDTEANVSVTGELPSLGTSARSLESQRSVEGDLNVPSSEIVVGKNTLQSAEPLRKKTVLNTSFSSHLQDTVLQVESDEDEPPEPSTSTTQNAVVQIQSDEVEAPGPSATSTASAQQKKIRTHRNKVVSRKTIRMPPHYMFLTSVLIGNAAQGQQSYLMPPLMDPAKSNSRRYDSCVGGLLSSPVFVVFRNNQVYPEYLIEYERKPVNRCNECSCSVKYVLCCICVISILLVVILGASGKI